jgi:hypothetical protein
VLRQTFADVLASAGSRAITGFIPFLKTTKAVNAGPGDKSLPPIGVLSDSGRMVHTAAGAYGRAWL